MYDMRKALRHFLQGNGIKQSYLAHKSGISPDRMSRILRGRRQLRADELMAFCRVLCVDPDVLARYGDDSDR
jgi:transcriptional regulator with XRE-family HTH domain